MKNTHDTCLQYRILNAWIYTDAPLSLQGFKRIVRNAQRVNAKENLKCYTALAIPYPPCAMDPS